MTLPVDYLGRVIKVDDKVVRAAVTGSQGSKDGTLETLTVTKVDEDRVFLNDSTIPVGGFSGWAHRYRKRYNARLIVIT